jgi:hypothetical protein
MSDTRIGDYIQTYSGEYFYPRDPRESDIRIEDIARSLSHQCRFAGHTMRFYSVAQHCVACAYQAPHPFKLEALLHDASETYLVDLPRPVKTMLPDYKEMERGIERVIARRFNLPYPMSPEVKEVDNRMLFTEAAWLLVRPKGYVWWEDKSYPNYAEPYRHLAGMDSWSPDAAMSAFLNTYHALNDESRV